MGKDLELRLTKIVKVNCVLFAGQVMEYIIMMQLSFSPYNHHIYEYLNYFPKAVRIDLGSIQSQHNFSYIQDSMADMKHDRC
jgi:hypothetical protein